MRLLSQLTKVIKNGALIGGVGIGLFFNYHVNYLLSSSGQSSTSLLTTRWITDLVTLGLLLGVIEAYDQRVTRLRRSRGKSFSLDRAGIAQINEELEINTEILHEDDREEVFVSLPKPTHTDLADQLRDAFERYQIETIPKGSGTPRPIEEYLEVCTLPYLPKCEGRVQVGLFAKKDIPVDTLFYWHSDLGVARSEDRHVLDPIVNMNRRTLTTLNGYDYFQGGGSRQRSGPGVLANFFWCNTDTTNINASSHILMPPNFLGDANCGYATVKREHQLCSALVSFREICAGDQILMFTGSGKNLMAIRYRLILSYLVRLIFPALLTIPFLKLYTHLSLYY